jgi:hypothetical protein
VALLQPAEAAIALSCQVRGPCAGNERQQSSKLPRYSPAPRGLVPPAVRACAVRPCSPRPRARVPARGLSAPPRGRDFRASPGPQGAPPSHSGRGGADRRAVAVVVVVAAA